MGHHLQLQPCVYLEFQLKKMLFSRKSGCDLVILKLSSTEIYNREDK